MNYEQFVRDNLAKKVKPNQVQIKHQLERAVQDLVTAQANLKIDATWALTIAYHAMIRAGRALMYAEGYLPTTNQTHKTIIEFIRIRLGDDFHELVAKFNRLRRRRHHFIYDSENHVNMEEAQSALETARKLIDKIKLIVKQFLCIK